MLEIPCAPCRQAMGFKKAHSRDCPLCEAGSGWVYKQRHRGDFESDLRHAGKSATLADRVQRVECVRRCLCWARKIKEECETWEN